MNKRRISRPLKQLVKERAHSCCEYCISQEAYSPDPFSNEHIIPIASGGSSAGGNLALACQGCNNFKYNKTSATDPVTLQEARLFNPRKDRWHDHFEWSRDCAELIGLTPTGRATIQELQLNRANVVNLRRVLILVGGHPPSHRPSS